MTDKETIEEKLKKLGQAIGSEDLLVKNVMSRIDTATFCESNRINNKLLVRRIIMNRFTKLAAAAVIIIAVILSITILDKSVTPAYGITDLPKLIKNAKTIHMKGWVYFPKEGQVVGEPAKLEFEYWFDVENGRYRLYKPGGIDKDTGEPRYYTTVSDGQYIMGETYHRPVKGKPWKSISFTKLSPFKARLETYKHSYEVLMRMFGIDQIEGSTKVGQEEIEGTVFDIWQNEFYLADGRRSKITTWLAPDSGDIGRVLFWEKKRKDDPNWRLALDFHTVELDVVPPAGIFDTEPPDGYRLDNTKETARTSVLGIARQRAMIEDYELHRHIGFTLSDGSVILSWSCPEKSRSSQSDLFKGLTPGGRLPEFAAKIESLTSVPRQLGINYSGYHLVYTQKEGNYYEWSLYVPDSEPPTRGSLLAYELNVKYEVDKNRFGTRPGNLSGDLVIDSSDDFNAWVRGAMAELSDDGKAPENITYERVLRLAEQIKESLVE